MSNPQTQIPRGKRSVERIVQTKKVDPWKEKKNGGGEEGDAAWTMNKFCRPVETEGQNEKKKS